MLVDYCQDSTWVGRVLTLIYSGLKVLFRSRSLHLNHIPWSALFHLCHACQDLFGEIIERLGVGRVLPVKRGWAPHISAFADLRIKLNRSQEGHTELLCRALHPALGEDIDLLVAMRAKKMTHVLDNAQHVDARGAEHLNGFAPVLQRNIGWR